VVYLQRRFRASCWLTYPCRIFYFSTLSVLMYSQYILDSDSYCFAYDSILTLYLGKCSVRKGQRSTTDDIKTRLIVVLSLYKGTFQMTSLLSVRGILRDPASSIIFAVRFLVQLVLIWCATLGMNLCIYHIWRVWKRFHPIWRYAVSKRHVDCSRTGDV